MAAPSKPPPPPGSKANYLALARSIVEARGGTLITSEYRNAKTTLVVLCAGRHRFETNYDRLKQEKWCRRCSAARQCGNFAHTIDEMRVIARSRGGVCLSAAYLGMKVKLDWSCHEHGPFRASPNNVVHNSQWCPDCGELEKGRDFRPVADVIAYVADNGGELLGGTDSYRGMKSRVEVRCADGHVWRVTVGSLLHAESWCPDCSLYRGEEIARRVFETTYGVAFGKCRPAFLTARSGRNLELDGFNAGLKLAFEYQGPHHARSDQMARDREKRRLCKKHGVRLVTIPFVKSPSVEVIAAEIGRRLLKFETGITVRLPAAPIFPRRLSELRALASARGWTLLEDEYLGESEAHRWKCSAPEHPVWKAAPYRIRKGINCAYCAGVGKKDLAWLSTWGATLGLTLLADTYRGSGVNYRWRCESGHQFTASLGNLKQRVLRTRRKIACSLCAGTHREVSLEDVRRCAAARNWTVTSTSYQNAIRPLSYVCSQGHIVRRSWNDIQQGRGCRVSECPDNRSFGRWIERSR